MMPRKLILTGILILMMSGCAAPTIDPDSPQEPTQIPEEEPLEPTETLSDTPTEQPTVEDEPTETHQDTLEVPTDTTAPVEPYPVEADSGEQGDEVVVPPLAATEPPNPIVQLTIQDLSQRLGISPEEIQVEEVVFMEWRDSSLGCPAPGMFYLQVITPGYRISLEAGGESYTYHTDSGERFVLCKFGRPDL
jgi:hypothetical protein